MNHDPRSSRDHALARARSTWAATLVVALFAPQLLSAQKNQSTLTLSAVLDSVRTGNAALRAAESRVRAAAGARTTARAFSNPVIGYQIDQTPLPGATALPADMPREAMVTATVPLEPLYQRPSRIAQADAQLRASEADAAAARQRLELQAAAAFYRLATAQIQSATTRDLLAWLDTLVEYNRSRVSEGVTAEADLIRSRTERDMVAAEAAMQSAELAHARAALGACLPPSARAQSLSVAAYDGAMRLPAGDAAPAGTAQTVLVSVDRRPDVRAARERLAASNAGVAQERSMSFRQVGATIGTMRSAGTTSVIAGLSLSLPVFDQNRGEIQRASAERDAAEFELAQERRTALADLEGAREAALTLTERATALHGDAFLTRATEARRITLGAYREGAVPLIQVIDAARAWAESRMTYYNLLFAQHQSVLALVVAEGGDLFAAASTLAPTGDSRE